MARRAVYRSAGARDYVVVDPEAPLYGWAAEATTRMRATEEQQMRCATARRGDPVCARCDRNRAVIAGDPAARHAEVAPAPIDIAERLRRTPPVSVPTNENGAPAPPDIVTLIQQRAKAGAR